MNRSSWKIRGDKKQSDCLGMKQQTARARLERMFILHLAKKCGMDKCFQCGYDIESTEEMSIEHVKPWGGNELGQPPNRELFWDLDNLALSHKWCNTACGRSGLGRYEYVGVNYVFDKRSIKSKPKGRAAICVDGKAMTLGEYEKPDEAAIAYDLALMFFRKGRGKLNFEPLRNDYEQYLYKHRVYDRSFFQVRNGKIKEAVNFLKENFMTIAELKAELSEFDDNQEVAISFPINNNSGEIRDIESIDVLPNEEKTVVLNV